MYISFKEKFLKNDLLTLSKKNECLTIALMISEKSVLTDPIDTIFQSLPCIFD